VICLITSKDETAYREPIGKRSGTQSPGHVVINVIKTKEMIVDYRKKRAEHAPILIDGAVVEQVKSFKFLGVHITNKLTWFENLKTVMKRAQLGKLKTDSVATLP
jgi:hypothetical protein